MYKVSIVMPIYNVEEFIDESIQSVLNQTMSQKDIELIMVDDCSTDNSGKIAKSYADRYDNIKYYCLEQNSGMAGKPRNVGMKMATGKYITFLDSDDVFIPDACELLFNEIEKRRTKFVASNFSVIDLEGRVITDYFIDLKKYRGQKFSITSMRERMELFKPQCWAKIINREFVMDNSIEFLEGLPAEDAFFSAKLFLLAEKGYYCSTPVLLYRKRDSGNLSESNNRTDRYFMRMAEAFRSIGHLFQAYNKSSFCSSYYLMNISYLIRNLFLSNQIDTEDKAKLLYSMSDLFALVRELNPSINTKYDTIGFTKVYSLDSYDDFVHYTQMIDDKYKQMGINEFKMIEKRIVSDLVEKNWSDVEPNEQNI